MMSERARKMMLWGALAAALILLVLLSGDLGYRLGYWLGAN